MASVVEILARLKADSTQFIAEMAKAQEATNKLDKSATKTSSILENKLKFALLGAATAAGAFSVKLLRDSVRAAQEAGAAQDRLARLLYNTGGATEEGIKILQQQAKALEASTVVTESNITTVQSQLATFDLHGRTIAELTPAILDYVVAEKGAGASADQFRQMTNGLAQALNGQFASLTAVGFVLDAETKKKIKSGTESERAAAIVQVLNSTYKDFAKTAGGTAAGAQVKLGNSIRNVQQAFGQALLPVIQQVQGFIASNLVPVLQNLQARFADKAAVEKFMKFMGGLLKSLVDFAQGVITVFEPIFTNILLPAFKLAVGAVIGFIKILGAVGKVLQKYGVFFTMVATAVLAYLTVTKIAVAATLGFGKAMLIVKKAQQAYAFWTYTTTGATTGFAGAMNLLKTAFLTNPIGIIIAAVIALGVGFKMLWDRSETFRKLIIEVGKAGLKVVGFLIRVVGFLAEAFLNIVTGPAKLFLKVLGFINPDAKKAYEGLKDMTNNVGKFFDDSAKKVEDYAKTLDKYAKITKKTKEDVAKNPEFKMPDLSGLGVSTKGAVIDPKEKAKQEAAAKALAEMKRNLKEAVDEYNDFIKGDFTTSFLEGADAAKNAVGKALDNLKAIFEAKAKMLKDQNAIDRLWKVFDGVTVKVKALAEQYAAVAQQIEDVQKKIDDAYDNLQRAIETRSKAMEKINEFLAKPFGEPSKIQKAMAGAEATVDSIIGMYDELVQAVNERFEQLAPGARDAVKDFLYAQTNGLLDAARMRIKAVKVLESAQKKLDDLVQKQQDFGTNLQKSLKSFGTAIADLSQTDSKATYKVIKTATGLVITQLKTSSSGVDAISKQLRDRLKVISDFAANAKKLLASGLNKQYIQQLLEAGPESAGTAVAALANASAAQIAEINSLYEEIGTISDDFGTQMSDKMYTEAINMATAFRDGAALGVELIDAAMTDIVTNISRIMGVLGNTGLTNAQALINALVNEFTVMSQEKVGPATQIVVDKIKTTLSVLGAVGLQNAQAFIDGLIGALTGKDNLNNVNLSATAIKTNIDTIMKLLAPEALTNGLGLINSLVTAFGGQNLTNVTTSATAIKTSIETALNTLRTLGTDVATDLAQGMYDKLLAEKARLVALAQSIAAAIAAALASAAAAIGVTVDTPTFQNPEVPEVPDTTEKGAGDFRKADEDTSRDSHTAAKAASSAATTAKKTATAITKSATTASKAAVSVAGSAKAGLPKFGITGPSAKPTVPNVGPAAPRGLSTPIVIPSPKPAPLPQNTITKLPSNLKSAPGPSEIRAATTVNISTTKVTPTVTPKTVAKAVASSTSKRK